MIKIGIVGSDNSHADAFSKLLNAGADKNDAQARLINPSGTVSEGDVLFPFPDFKVSAIYGTDPARNAEVAAVGKIPLIAGSLDELAENCDAVMIVWRHGDLHYEYALPFLKRGMPVWIDKPFTNDPQQARAIFKLAEAQGSIIAGGSTVKYLPKITELKNKVAAAGTAFKGGSMTYAVDMKNAYGDIFFYGQHLVECALTVFGHDVKSVFATESEGGATAMLNYEDKSCALHFVTENYRYRVLLHIGGDTVYEDFDIPGSYYYGFAEYATAIKSGKTLVSADDTIKAVDVLSAIHKSAKAGCMVKI